MEVDVGEARAVLAHACLKECVDAQRFVGVWATGPQPASCSGLMGNGGIHLHRTLLLCDLMQLAK